MADGGVTRNPDQPGPNSGRESVSRRNFLKTGFAVIGGIAAAALGHPSPATATPESPGGPPLGDENYGNSKDTSAVAPIVPPAKAATKDVVPDVTSYVDPEPSDQ